MIVLIPGNHREQRVEIDAEVPIQSRFIIQHRVGMAASPLAEMGHLDPKICYIQYFQMVLPLDGS
jgi:hypothetical protein